MGELFGEAIPGEEPTKPAEAAGTAAEAGAAIRPPVWAGGGAIVSVAVAANVWRPFDYLWPAALPAAQCGLRVRVPFGRADKQTLGFVVGVNYPASPGQSPATPWRGPSGPRKLKAVTEVLDAEPGAAGTGAAVEPAFDEPLWRLAEWISHYYLTPLGMVLAAMVPSAVGRHGPRSETVVYLAKQRHDWPERLGGRQKRLLDELYEAAKQGIEPLTLEALLRHSGASRESLRRLAERELVRLDARPVVLAELPDHAAADPFELNDDQKAVLAALEGKLEAGFSVTLLHGVTGSGKTEVYIRAIRRVVAAGRQAILLVPEIALATQTLTRLVERLPRVAVLHSGLSGAERAFHYRQIRDGVAAAVVGPRSAIFAPARKLGLIIVDEEHEPSYKQDTAPRYHGRDVAVVRGRLAGVPVLLGSATPSLESLHNARQGRYDLLRLPRRVRGLPMPKLQIVHLRREMTPGRIELIGKTLTGKIAAALDRREQIILLMNRRGYASYVFCPSCHWTMGCEHCTRAMVFHQATQLAVCHYCQHTAPLPEYCPACRGKLLLFGFGVQRIEAELTRKFPAARTARMDSDTMTSPTQFRKVFEAFGTGELDILLGTQMVAKGLDFPRVSLVGVVSADTSLAIPDFRAAERTFQLVVQVAGRAGRSDLPGEVVVQTLHADDPAIRFAEGHDYDGFAAAELELRRSAQVPPFVRMVRFVARHADTAKAELSAATLAGRLRQWLAGAKVSVQGPQPATVRKIKNRFRYHLLLSGPAGAVQNAVAPRMEELCKQLPAEIVADADPMNLL